MRRLSYSLGSLLSIEEVLECSQKLNEIKTRSRMDSRNMGHGKFCYAWTSIERKHIF